MTASAVSTEPGLLGALNVIVRVGTASHVVAVLGNHESPLGWSTTLLEPWAGGESVVTFDRTRDGAFELAALHARLCTRLLTAEDRLAVPDLAVIASLSEAARRRSFDGSVVEDGAS